MKHMGNRDRFIELPLIYVLQYWLAAAAAPLSDAGGGHTGSSGGRGGSHHQPPGHLYGAPGLPQRRRLRHQHRVSPAQDRPPLHRDGPGTHRQPIQEYQRCHRLQR